MDDTNKQTLVLCFDVTGRLKYLSHRETARMFERALVRAGVGLCYSMGFNPHPKISLPLARTVGVASEGDLLCAEINSGLIDIEKISDDISKQLPEGCRLVKLDVVNTKVSYRPTAAGYEFVVDSLDTNETIKHKLAELADLCRAGGRITVSRWSDKKNKSVVIDVGKYIKDVEVKGDKVSVSVSITPEGTIRVNEILELAGVSIEDIGAGVTRRDVVFS